MSGRTLDLDYRRGIAGLLLASAIGFGCGTTRPPVRDVATLAVSAPATAPPVCEASSSTSTSGNHGIITVPAKDGTTHSLYFLKLPAKQLPTKGTLFYLAGGPLSHLNYLKLATIFQATAYPQFDVVLYDYFGFNCSSALQDVAQLDARARTLTMPAMAEDFIHLKRSLVGSSPAYIMGGSHGAMLGAQIVAEFPADIAKAVLFSGDTESGWLAEGWFRFDAVLAKLASEDTAFATDLQRLLDRAAHGGIAVEVRGQQRIVDRPALEVALWLAGGLSAAVQAALPAIVKATLDGRSEVMGRFYGAELALLEPIGARPLPTDVSVVTSFFRCNVWLPPSARASSGAARRSTTYLDYQSLTGYWTQLCRAYDHLGEFPHHAMPPRPTDVPILSWVGERDTFDPDAVRAHLAGLSSRVEFEVVPGWSHDFGPDAGAGIRTAAQKVRHFFDEK